MHINVIYCIFRITLEFIFFIFTNVFTNVLAYCNKKSFNFFCNLK